MWHRRAYFYCFWVSNQEEKDFGTLKIKKWTFSGNHVSTASFIFNIWLLDIWLFQIKTNNEKLVWCFMVYVIQTLDCPWCICVQMQPMETFHNANAMKSCFWDACYAGCLTDIQRSADSSGIKSQQSLFVLSLTCLLLFGSVHPWKTRFRSYEFLINCFNIFSIK